MNVRLVINQLPNITISEFCACTKSYSRWACEGRGLVGPARQRTAFTGAPDSIEKSVLLAPTGMCSGRSRLVQSVVSASWRRLLLWQTTPAAQSPATMK